MTKLSRAVIVCISAMTMSAGVAALARADTVPIDDPLHGHCLAGCIDNGTNTPIIGPTNGFYFQASPGPQTGIVLVDILVPNNIPLVPGSIVVAVIGGGTTAALPLFGGDWTSGTLGAFLGAGGSLATPNISPANPIGAFLPSTQALDPGATGFHVSEAILGTDPRTLAQEGTAPVPGLIFNISGPALPIGSYVLANLVQSDGNTIATANSAALFAGSACTGCSNPPSVAVPGPIAGAGLPGLIVASGGILGWWRRRRQHVA